VSLRGRIAVPTPAWRSSDRIQKLATGWRRGIGHSTALRLTSRTRNVRFGSLFGSTEEDHLAHGVRNATVVRTLLAEQPVETVLAVVAADRTKIIFELSSPEAYALPPAESSEPVEVSACTQLLHVTFRRPIRRSNGSVIQRHLPSCMGAFSTRPPLTDPVSCETVGIVGRLPLSPDKRKGRHV
jgi:hypothetical protein